jgi:protein involved in polysaccharide export with SLBB domain
MSTMNRIWQRPALIALVMIVAASGCSTWRNAIPSSCVRPNLFDAPRSRQEPINFIRLRKDPPPVYMLGPEDILGIYIEGVLGDPEEPPPVHFPEDENIPPAVGFPTPVREDGTLSLPLVPPIMVEGLTLAQAEAEVRNAYTIKRRILVPGRDRIIVTLMRRRTYQVLVVREDTTSSSFFPNWGGGGGGGGNQGQFTIGSMQRGMTYTVELPAYENDVLHALSESGGLPGLDAKNEIVILRGAFDTATGPNALLMSYLEEISNDKSSHNADGAVVIEDAVAQAPPGGEGQIDGNVRPLNIPNLPTDPTAAPPEMLITPEMGNATAAPFAPGYPTTPAAPFSGNLMPGVPGRPQVIRIPMRAAPGQPLPQLTQEDITLRDGDILFIESRDAEVFYTGGLLPGGQHVIPRDYDLDVLGAISMAGGSIGASAGTGGGGGFGGGGGIGSIFPPTQVIVVRIVNGRQLTIRTNIRTAVLDPRERILIIPNDLVMLEFTPCELIGNILLNNLQFNYFLNGLGGGGN